MIYILFNNSNKGQYYAGYDYPTIMYISKDKQKCIDILAKKKDEYLSANPDGKIEVDTELSFGLDCGKWYYDFYIEEYPYETEI